MPFIQKLRRVKINDKNFTNNCYHFYNDTVFFKDQLFCWTGRIFTNPKQEIRARNISKNIRCLVCQNQSIDDSSAPLAKDLRALIRLKVQENDSDEEIYKFLTDRYGDFILLKPPFNISTFLLWSLPFVFVIIGIFILFVHNKKSKKLS